MAPAIGPAVATNPPRVLVAEDSEGVRRLYELRLRHAGDTVLTAGSGREAYEVARREAPVAILTDVWMPDGGGWWLLARVRQDFLLCETPVVFVTNKGSVPHPLQLVGVQPHEVLDKDLDLHALERAVNDATQMWRVLRDRLDAGDEAPVAGVLAGPGSAAGGIALLRHLAFRRASGRLRLEDAYGGAAELGLLEGTVLWAEVTGPRREAGPEAMVVVASRRWERFRLSREEAARNTGAPALGALETALRQACALAQRRFEHLRLTSEGETDPERAASCARAASPLAAPAVRALLDGKDVQTCTRATGLAEDVVRQLLFDLVTSGALRFPSVAEEARLAARRMVDEPIQTVARGRELAGDSAARKAKLDQLWDETTPTLRLRMPVEAASAGEAPAPASATEASDEVAGPHTPSFPSGVIVRAQGAPPARSAVRRMALSAAAALALAALMLATVSLLGHVGDGAPEESATHTVEAGPRAGAAEAGELTPAAGPPSLAGTARAATSAGPVAVPASAELVALGKGRLLAKDPAGAIRYFTDARILDPGDADACRGLVDAHTARREKAAATEALDCYLRLRPDAGDSHALKARVSALE